MSAETPVIQVTGRDGETHALEGITGWRVMEIIRDYGANNPALAIKAECGGAMACATCHVYVAEEWLDKIPAQHPDEADILEDFGFGVEGNSRLSCQIILGPELDGLAVTLAPGTEP